VEAVSLVDGEGARSIADRLASAASACSRAAVQLRRPLLPRRREVTGPADARLLLAWDDAGNVADAEVLSPSWRSPELTTCLEANARLLATPSAAGALGFLVVPLASVPLE